MNIKTISILILTVGVLIGAYVFFFMINKKHPDFKELKPDHIVSAETIYKDFTADAEKAGQQYTGKIVQLSGEVNSFEQVDSLSIAVYVFNEGMFGNEGVRCTFLPDQGISSIEDLIGFDIKGFCSGYNETDVILEKCSLIK